MTERNGALGTASRRSVPVRGGLAIALAVSINVVIVLLVGSLDLVPDFQPLTVPPVAFLSALGAAGATFVYRLCFRYFTDSERIFVWIAAVVLVLSFLPDVALLRFDPAATVPSVAVLMLMHVVVAAVSVALIVYRGNDRHRPPG